jgi:hypothetical protein
MRRLAVALVVGTSGFVALHELGRRWGATREELRAPMAGDDIVAHAKGPGETWPREIAWRAGLGA